MGANAMNKLIIVYVLIALVVIGLIILTINPGFIYVFRDSAGVGGDKCAPAPGYTEQEWKEHMSHHPSLYRECLS